MGCGFVSCSSGVQDAYDVELATSSKLHAEVSGKPISTTYSLPNGHEIVVRYLWDSVRGTCRAMEASVGQKLFAKAKVVDGARDPATGHLYIVVEELQYSDDGSGKVIYKGNSKYDALINGEKLEEKTISGVKRYRVFPSWITLDVMFE